MMAVMAVLVVLCTVVIALTHVNEQRSQQAATLGRLSSATATLAAQLNGEQVVKLLAKYSEPDLIIKHTQDAWYYVLHDHLRRSTERLALERPMRIVAPDSLRGGMQIVVTADVRPTYRSPLTDLPDLNTHVQGRMAGEVRIDNRTLLAFEALTDEHGNTVAYVLGETSVAAASAGAQASLWRNIILAIVLLVIAGSALFASVGRWVSRDAAAHDALQERHSSMADSIAYAGKIQRALVPAPQVYSEIFGDAFVIDRPKDLVSGDFHWVYRVDEHTTYVAAADCTGHGLPGAMMAAIGCSLLNEIVPNHAEKDPAELLGMLNTRLVTTLHQQGRKRGGGDGMDVALCRIDKRNNTILFAGAFRPLYWSHRDRLTVINGDRRPIGGAHQELERKYTCHRLATEPGDRIYLFSDGYVDQFGGPEGQRFMSTRLHALLDEHRTRNMADQRDVLERAFLDWKGNKEQVDDVCLLGIAV